LVSSFWSLVPGVVNLGAIENRLDFGVDVSKKSLNSSSRSADGDVFLLKRDCKRFLTDELSVVEGRENLVLVGLGVVLPGVVVLNEGEFVSFAPFAVVTPLNWAPIVGVGSVPIV